MAQNLSELHSHLNRVRWAWKRAAALQGLAAVVIEGIGMFLLFLLLDYIYVMPQTTRVLVLAAMGGMLAFLFVRHVVRPLARVIPDEQIALYIEERQESEGALLSATEFGKSGSQNNPIYNFIVQNIVSAAVTKAGAIQLSRVLDVGKLKKYGIAAAIVLLFFATGAVKFSSFFGHHAGRLLMPWNNTEEDLRASGALIDSEPKLLFDISVNPGGDRVLRGSAVSVKAKLSRISQNEVVIKFRTKGTAEFQKLKMEEIEELNTFALRLPDINDDLELFVQSGNYVSDNVNLSVYDRLELKGYELTLTPPAYTKQKPIVEFGPSGDLTALAGTTVQVRALANTPLAKGEISFADGSKLALTGETAGEHGARGEFTVKEETTYTVSITSKDGQSSEQDTPFSIKVLKDEPPSLTVISSDLSVHPISEVEFAAKVNDDVGIGSVELIYNLADSTGATERLPFKVTDSTPGEKDIAVTLPLAEMATRVKPGDSLFYHVIVKDLKGQQAVSDIYMMKVRPFEIAGAYPTIEPPHAPHAKAPPLMLFIAALWNIHTQKDTLEKPEFAKLCDELHSKMVQPNGMPIAFDKPKISKLPPDKQELVRKGDALVAEGINLLKVYNTGDSVAKLREALALYERASSGMDMKEKAPSGGGSGAQADPMKDALGFVKMEIPMPPAEAAEAAALEAKLPEYRRAITSEDAKQLREETQRLQKLQEKINEEARKLAAMENKDNPEQTADKKDGDEKDGEKKDGEKKEGEEQTADAKGGDKKDGEKKDGDKQSADAKGGDKKDGEKKDGDKQSADAKGGDQKDGEKKDGDKQSADAKGGAKKPSGDFQMNMPKGSNDDKDASGDVNERKKDLERNQENLANQVRKAGERLAAKSNSTDKNTKEVVELLRKTMKEMDAALKEMKEGSMQMAAARGEQAKNDLGKVADKLQVSQFEDLEAAVEAAEDRAAQIANVQKKIKESTGKVVDDANKRMQAEGKAEKNGEVKLNSSELTKLHGLAKLQVENQKAAENLENYVGELAKWADDQKKTEAAEGLKKAAKTMTQENVASTMVTAAVAMGQQELGEAKEAHDKADRTMSKVTAALQTAASSLATSNEEKIKRALKDAKDIQAKVNKLTGKPEDGKKDPAEKQVADAKGGDKKDGEKKDGDKQSADAKGGDKKDGEKKDGDKQSADAKGGDKKDGEKKDGDKQSADAKGGDKKDGEKKDGDKQSADAKGGDKKDGEKKDGDKQSADAKGGDKKDGEKKDGEKGEQTADGDKNHDKKGDEKGEKGKELTADEKRQLQNEIMRDTARLARRMEQDKLSDGKIHGQLKSAAENEKSFDEMFKEGQKTKLDQYLKTVKAASTHLEGKLDSVLKAKRLSAAQREQTPIQYREMVNKYYEQLAKE